ncbi:DUF3108 domain-containing protein [Frateuria aurantia]
MANLSRLHISIFTAGLLLSGVASASTSAPTGFVAHYQVSRDGQPLGTATLTLEPGQNGAYRYTSQVDGSAGVAALLAASVNEESQFRWNHGTPESLEYHYQMQSAFKTRHRQMSVDWNSGQVSVDEGKGVQHYAAKPGMVDHNLLLLAIGWNLQQGRSGTLSVPVAVRQTVETEHFTVSKDGPVTVPAGSFATTRVDRSDAGKALSAWYAPAKFPVPVKLSQQEGGDITMQLVDFKAE